MFIECYRIVGGAAPVRWDCAAFAYVSIVLINGSWILHKRGECGGGRGGEGEGGGRARRTLPPARQRPTARTPGLAATTRGLRRRRISAHHCAIVIVARAPFGILNVHNSRDKLSCDFIAIGVFAGGEERASDNTTSAPADPAEPVLSSACTLTPLSDWLTITTVAGTQALTRA